MLNNVKIITVVAALSLILAGCGGQDEKVSLDDALVQSVVAEDGNGGRASVEEEPQQDAEIRTARVQEIAALTSYAGVGSFMPEDELNISSEMGGTLIELRFDKGDVIKIGQKVAQVDPANTQLMLENAEAQLEIANVSLELAKSEYARKKKLLDDGAIPAATFDAVSTQLDLAHAQKRAAEIGVRQAKKAVTDTVTLSPVSGVVSFRHVSRGEYVGAGDPLVTVSVLNPLKLVFSVPERLAPRITPGTEIEVSLAAFPGQTFKGTISLIGPLVNVETRSVPVEATFKNTEGNLKPGYFAEVEVPLSESQRQFRVPAAALHDSEGGYMVIVAGSDNRIPVSVISSSDSEAIVTGELSHGLEVELRN